MKRVLLHGYTMHNLGDDLFFRVITARYPQVQFVLPMLNTDYKEKFSDIKNLTVVDFCKIAKVTEHKIYMLPKLYSKLFIKRFDAVVCIGGSLFIDRKNPGKKDRIEAEKYSFIYDWEIAQKANIPYFVLGANWGPCYNDYFFECFDRAFDSLRDLCFRDRYSYALFEAKPMVRYSGDILMGARLISSCCTDEERLRQVAVSVIDVAKKADGADFSKAYIQKMTSLCCELIADQYRVVLLSFCEWEGDLAIAKQLQESIADRCGQTVPLLSYRNNWQEMLQTIARSELTVASRFHATVLSWALGTPAFSLTYSEKTDHYIEDFHMAKTYRPVVEVETVTAEDIVKNADCPPPSDGPSSENIAFAVLDEYLKSTGGI